MRGLVAHFSEEVRGAEFRQWSVAQLDFAREHGRDDKTPTTRELLTRLRRCPCAVVKRASKLAAHSGPPSARSVDDFIMSLRMGQVSWASLDL